MNTTRPAWLVLATICSCNKVAVTIMDRAHVSDIDEAWAPGFDGADPDSQVVMSGPDWRPLIVEAAKQMRERSSLPISPGCSETFKQYQCVIGKWEDFPSIGL
jgi:hypothetical protein